MLTEEDVASAAAGEPAGHRSVYESLAPALVGYLRSRGSEDPEGLTQDVFCALLPKLTQVEGGATGLRTLAFSIAHARLVDENRRRARRPTPVPLTPEDDPRVAPSAEEDALKRVQGAVLIGMLGELGDEQRNVVALRIIGQLSLEETADVTGKSIGAVKQLQRRGLLSLRDRVLAREGVTP